MKRISALLLVFFLFSPCVVLAQEKAGSQPILLVLDIQPIGVEKITAEVAVQLLRYELAKTGAFRVVEKGEIERKLGPAFGCYLPQCASEAGKQIGASRALIGMLSRLGEKFFFEVQMVDVENARAVYSARMTSATIEDMETVTKRLAMAVAQGKSPEETITIETVTAKEAEEVKKREAFHTGGFTIGFVLPTGDSYGGVDRLTRLDVVYLYDVKRLVVESRVGWAWSSEESGRDAFDFHIDFAGYYAPLPGDYTPYVGGGGGLYTVNVSREVPSTDYYDGIDTRSASDSLFGMHIGGGFMFFRTYDIRLILDVRYDYIFGELDGKGAQGFVMTFGLTYRPKHRASCCIF